MNYWGSCFMKNLLSKIISIGDFVKLDSDNKIDVHSRFRNVVNLKGSSGIISIVTPEIGGGPNNIVVDINDLNQIEEIRIRDGQMYLDYSTFDFSFSKRYDSKIRISNINSEKLLSNLLLSEQVLLKKSSPVSCAFLIDETRELNFRRSIEIIVKERIKSSFNDLMNGSFNSVKELRGLGPGLTPQGDDLINGIIISLSIYEMLFKKPTVDLRRRFYSYARSVNILSSTFLYYSSISSFYEPFKDYLFALMFMSESVISATERLIGFGETSGADILSGFIISLKKFFKGGLLWL
jgi:hypothetical protein